MLVAVHVHENAVPVEDRLDGSPVGILDTVERAPFLIGNGPRVGAILVEDRLDGFDAFSLGGVLPRSHGHFR